jgi:hypothetical protein
VTVTGKSGIVDDGPRGRPEATMTSGISGSGGPRGPGGTQGPADAAETDSVNETEGPVEAGQPLEVHAARAAAVSGIDTGGVDRIAADLDAGRISGREALDRLIDEAVPGELDDAERAELREAMADLLASDPHLAGLAARIGAGHGGGDD